MSGGLHLCAYLMSTSGQESYLKKTQSVLLRQNAVIGYHGFSVRRFSLAGVYPDDIVFTVLFHPSGESAAAFFHLPVNSAQIFLCHLSAPYFFIYPPESLCRFCRDHYSAGISVDSVAKRRRKAPLLIRTVFAAPPEISLYMVYQGAALVCRRTPGTGTACVSAVNRHSRFFVNKNKLAVFVKNRNIGYDFHEDIVRRCFKQLLCKKKLDGIAFGQNLRRLSSSAVYLDFLFSDGFIHK